MAYASIESPLVGWVRAPERSAHYAAASRHIAILLFDGCSLLGAGIVAEVFHAANELASSANRGWTYDVSFLSAAGGNITCSSSIRVWTDGLDARHYMGFDALFVAGGKGARAAAHDERLIAWLRRVHANTSTVKPIGEGRALLEAACIANGVVQQREFGSYNVRDDREDRLTAGYNSATGTGSSQAASTGNTNGNEANDRLESMKSALMLIKRDLGIDVARNVAERLMPDAGESLVSLLGDSTGRSPADKVRAAARWIQENCQRPISIADAAQVAAMSERNFLRRFKMEVGVTPSDYLLHARLAITCSLLTDSELPVDKIARRTGMGNGDRLAKIFRKRMKVSPTEYRMKTRREAGI